MTKENSLTDQEIRQLFKPYSAKIFFTGATKTLTIQYKDMSAQMEKVMKDAFRLLVEKSESIVADQDQDAEFTGIQHGERPREEKISGVVALETAKDLKRIGIDFIGASHLPETIRRA